MKYCEAMSYEVILCCTGSLGIGWFENNIVHGWTAINRNEYSYNGTYTKFMAQKLLYLHKTQASKLL